MRGLAIAGCLFAVGCGRHHEPPTRGPAASQAMRCTLRITQRGTFVDGDQMPRSDAVARCKRTAGAVVVIETNARAEWDPTTCTIVTIDDAITKATKAEWDQTRWALQREGVPVYVRGPTGDIRAGRLPGVSPPERQGCEVLPPLVDPR